MNKAQLRAQIRAARKGLAMEQQQEAAARVYAHLMGFEPYRAAGCVMAYMACRGELSLEPVIRDALEKGKTLLLPRCEAQGVMTARQIRGLHELLPGAYGLAEPDAACERLDPQAIDVILVPGVAFDRAGRRLGQGGGYYDRFLRQSPALRVGICHESALLDRVPCQEHDEPMDYVITPGGISRIFNRRT